jgi:hypothetical protein
VLFRATGVFRLRLQTEHGVYAGAWRLDGRVAALEGGERIVVFGGWIRSYRLLRWRLLHGGLLDGWQL